MNEGDGVGERAHPDTAIRKVVRSARCEKTPVMSFPVNADAAAESPSRDDFTALRSYFYRSDYDAK